MVRIRAFNIPLLWATLLLATTLCAHGGDCSTSKPFHLKKPQALSGILQDPVGAVLPQVELELLSGKSVFRHLRTDNFGKYDFGEVPAGEYRIYVQVGSNALCAPKVRCRREECTVEQRLKVNSKDTVTVY